MRKRGVTRLILAWLVFATHAVAQVITTVAGTTFTFPSQPLPAVSAPLGQVFGVAIDSKGNVYATDVENNLVVQIAPGGTLTVVAGNNTMGFSGDGGPATSAALSAPTGVAVDSVGNLYIADAGNGRVRKVSGGIITTIAGSGAAGASGDGGLATSASLSGPSGVAVDSAGNIYIAEQFGNRIRKVSGGIITTVAGNLTPGFSGDGGLATSASLNVPIGVAVDSAGNIYIADAFNFRIRKVSGGIITTVAGNGTQGTSGDGGLATSASLFTPKGVAVDSAGNIYVADQFGGRVRKVSGGIIASVPGGGASSGVAVDSAGNIYITDQFNDRVRKLAGGVVLTIAGNGAFKFAGDGGTATSAALDKPQGVAVDAAGALYIADTRNLRIRKVSGGIITTFAGGGNDLGDGGPATSASLNFTSSVAVDSIGNVYFPDISYRVRRVSGGIITTVAGNGTGGFSGDGGPATSASLAGPLYVAVDSAGNVYIADSSNNRIRKVSKGIITTIAGNGTAGFSGDGGPATSAGLSVPTGVAVDSSGNVYIADEKNNRIRKVSGGLISTFAGNGQPGFSGDGGPATSASLSSPAGVAVDSAGNVYITDVGNDRIREISGGVITTIAGNGITGFSGDGGRATSAALSLVCFNCGDVYVDGIAVDSTGSVYFTDVNNDRIRKVLPTQPSFQASPISLSFSGVAGGSPPSAQTVSLSPSVPGLGFSASASTSWLSATPSSGAMPASLQVIADPSQLPAGSYSGTISVTAPDASPSTANISVTFAVSPAISGKLALGSTSLAFSFTQSASPTTQQLTVSNQGSGSIRYTASASTTTGGNWLAASLTTGVTPAAVNVTATPGSLAVGTYNGTITVTSPDTGQSLTVPVTMAISAPPQKILLSQTGLTFTAVAQGGVPLPQSFGILNIGQGALNWTASATTISGGSGWLHIDTNGGTVATPFTDVSLVNVSIDPSGLAPNEYYGQIQVRSIGASNSPQTVSVILNVLNSGSNPGPEVRPSGLIFTGVAGATPGSQDVLVGNPTGQQTDYDSGLIPQNAAAFSFLPTNSTVQPKQPTTLKVYPDLTKVTPGSVQRGTITLQFSDGTARTISVLTVVGLGGSPGGSNEREASGCSPTKLLPVFAQLGSGPTVPGGWPVTVTAKVVDDCGSLMTSGSVVASFSNGDSPISLVSLQDGNWAGSWQPVNGAAGGVAVTLNAQIPAPNIAGTAQLSIGLQGNKTLPVLSGGPVSAVTLAEGPLAPGDLILIKGSSLADGPASSSAALQPSLAGASLVIGGSQAQLLYVDGGQILAQVPANLAVNTSQSLVVLRDNTVGIPTSITISAAHPAILTAGGTGQGQGVIYKSGGLLADASNPVKAGDTIVIYCTGLGTTDANGNATNIPKLTIGGQAAQVSYAGVALKANYPSTGAPTLLGGLAPVGLGGLDQITATIPGGLPGGAASVVLSSVGQTSSAGVTLAIAGGNVPTITSINTAYGSADIGQNDFIEIKGTNLAAATAGPAALSTALGGVSVTVNGRPALLYYVSAVQINALTPLDSTIGPVSVVVTSNGAPSSAFTANLRTVTPAFLRFDVGGHITAEHADGSFLGPSSLGSAFTPAAPGETIMTFAIGFGLPTTALVPGSAAQSGPLPTLPVCQIGGAPATVAFAGLNGFAGLYQLNLVVPAGAANGDSAVSCTYGGQTTPAGTLVSVQR